MKNLKNLLFYVAIIGGFSVGIYWILAKGTALLETGRSITAPPTGRDRLVEFLHDFQQNLHHPLALLLIQIVAIILVARLFGWICQKIGQPSVVGEIIAGIVLGPSLLGLYFPETFATLFPESSLGNLKFLSQIGLIFFMFIVGMELDLKILKNKAHEAVVISHASIIFPFGLGVGLAYFLYTNFAPANIPFSSFALFMGIAMSITAFPVLARIVQERGIHKTKLGAIVITCAAADDITAWCVLAAVIAIVKAGSFVSALYTIALSVAYVLVMLKLIRPFLKRIGDLNQTREHLSKPVVAIFFIMLLLSAYATEIIGIHALFGAFMAGVIMPENARFRNVFTEKLEDVAIVMLLPLFFVFTGLRTEIGLLNNAELWKTCGIIIVIAVVGKFVGSAVAARFVGQNWKESLTIGALMNTRGLMELVALNIGYDLGVLTPEVFAMMVIMALATTFLTGPALDLINRVFREKPTGTATESDQARKYKVLISFKDPEDGRSLLRIANGLVKKLNGNAAVTAMHLTPVDELHHYNIEEYEQENFEPMLTESKKLNQSIQTLFKPSGDIGTEITEVANEGDYDLLLVGIGHSIFEGSLLGRVLGFTTRIINPERILDTVTGKENLFESAPYNDSTRQIFADSKVPVGILVDKGVSALGQVFMPVLHPDDIFMMQYVQKLIHNSGSQVTIFDNAGHISRNAAFKENIRSIEQNAPQHISLLDHGNIERDFLQAQSLMIISLNSWRKLTSTRNSWLNYAPSVLILKP